MSELQMLTTVDNPYNPFDDWDEWYAFDSLKGYNTSGLIARIAVDASSLSDQEDQLELYGTHLRILELFGDGFYRIVTKTVDDEV